jgi:hypothetical protein
MKDEQQAGSGQQQTGFGKVDARYSEEPHVITDRLRSTMANSAQGDFLVIGTRQDGSPFAWSTGDENKTLELAKASPVLAELANQR